MNKKEYIEHLRSLIKTDRELANALSKEYHADSMATLDQLTARAEAKLGRTKGRIAMADGKVASGLPAAFDITEAQLRRLIDPNSKENWMTLPSSEIRRAAIRAGYMKDLPNNASEEQKAENRKGLKDFLDLLAAESTAQGRRNAVAEYQNTKFSKEPWEWTKKQINNMLFRTTANRMLEQALRGQGPSGFTQMNAGDAGALAGDIGVNALFGAGTAGMGRALARPLMSTRDVLLAPAAAGAAAGGLDAFNRGINTENGARWYEYPAEAFAGAVGNAVGEPRVFRQMAREAGRVLKGATVAGKSSRQGLKKAQEFANQATGMDEVAVRDLLDELALNPNPGKAAVTAEQRKKISEMGEILDDGMTLAPGEEASLFDQAQAMYERGSYFPDGKPTTPEIRKIMMAKNLDWKIGNIEGELKNAAGAQEAPQLQRQLKYFKTLRDMNDNGLLEGGFEGMFFEKNPEAYVFKNRPEPGAKPFEISPGGRTSDLSDVRTIVAALQDGNVAREDIPGLLGMSEERYSDLLARYPEVSKLMQTQRTYRSGDRTLPYGTSFVPKSGEILANLTQPKVAAQTGTESVLRGIVQPVLAEKVMEKYDRPENSEESITREFEQLMARKPEAANAALGWKFDPRLPADRQLDEYDRTVVNKYRAMLQEKAMRGE